MQKDKPTTFGQAERKQCRRIGARAGDKGAAAKTRKTAVALQASSDGTSSASTTSEWARSASMTSSGVALPWLGAEGAERVSSPLGQEASSDRHCDQEISESSGDRTMGGRGSSCWKRTNLNAAVSVWGA